MTNDRSTWERLLPIARRLLPALVALLLVGAPASRGQLAGADVDAKVPPAPNYADAAAWAAWPGRPSGADAVPSESSQLDQQSTAKVDVFFVHPTTYLTRQVGNAAFDAGGVARLAVDRTVLRYQAGAFNGCCRIFVPHYRQASVGSFFSYGSDSVAAIELAYSDVARAFDYYLAHANGGRPFIIASHSQGSIHTMRLIQERIAGKPLQQKLVAAYVVGYSIPVDIERAGIPICESARQTGCLVHWATVKSGEVRSPEKAWIWLDGRYQPAGGRRLVCVNPLNWQRDASAPASANLGALPKVWPGQALPKPLPGLTGATCQGGLLVVSLSPFAAGGRFNDLLTVFGSYHDFDYHLFYMNIRQNAAERVAAFLGHP